MSSSYKIKAALFPHKKRINIQISRALNKLYLSTTPGRVWSSFVCVIASEKKYLAASPLHTYTRRRRSLSSTSCLATVELYGVVASCCLSSCSGFWPLKSVFRWSGRETRMWSTQRVTPILSSRPTIISSSKKPGWPTPATTRAWPKTSSLAAKAPLPRSLSMVGDDFFQQMSKLCTETSAGVRARLSFQIYKRRKLLGWILLSLHAASLAPHFHINLCMLLHGRCVGASLPSALHTVTFRVYSVVFYYYTVFHIFDIWWQIAYISSVFQQRKNYTFINHYIKREWCICTLITTT